ncbi:MAG: hypothetical protein ACPGSI_01530 [Pikeienuella sp.]
MTDTTRLSQLALILSAFALMFAVSMFWPLVTDNMMFERTHATAWAMTLLATPAFYIFARNYGDDLRPLTNWWRLTWTAGWVMSLIHLWFGLGEMHQWDALSVFTRQGFALAATIFGLILVWGIDVIYAWIRPDWAEDDIWIRRIAFWWALLAFFVSTVIFNNDLPSLVVGLVMTGAIAVAVFQRIDGQQSWRAAFDGWVPPAVIGGILVPATLFGPVFLGEDSMLPSVIAEMQARLTVWPVLILGGVAAALFIAKAPERHWNWGWAAWSIAGYLAYLVHIYAAVWEHFGGWSATLAHQGWLVLGANLFLLAIWTVSSGMAAYRKRAVWLHGATMLTLIVLTVMSVWDRETPVFWLGVMLAGMWVLVGGVRAIRSQR